MIMMNKEIMILCEMIANSEEDINLMVLSENEFLSNQDYLYFGYGFINQVIECLLKINKKMLFVNEGINMKFKELIIIKDYLINSYGGINGYLIYDFLKVEYPRILNEIKEYLDI